MVSLRISIVAAALVALGSGCRGGASDASDAFAPEAFEIPSEVRALTPPMPAREGRGRVQHVVLFVADTLRADRVPPRALPRIHSPALAQHAKSAVVFDEAYSTSNWTKSAMASLLTGLEVHRHGALTHEHKLSESHLLLMEMLKAHGFYTAGVLTNGYLTKEYGFDRAWDRVVHAKDSGRARGHFVAEDVERVLAERPKDKPLFLYVHTTDAHSPYEPPARDVSRYDPDPYQGAVRFRGDKLFLERIRRGEIKMRRRDRQRLVALYDAEVTYHDRQFARVKRALAKEGILDDALFIFTSDHGEELFDHGSVAHGWRRLYQELVHVPLMISGPGYEPARRTEQASLLDVLPTVLDALGMSIDPTLVGRSLAGTLPSRRPLLFESYGIHGLLDGHKKLAIRTYPRPTAVQLFDLARDPFEHTNLAEEQPDEVARLTELLHRLRSDLHVASRITDVELEDSTRRQLRELGYID
jgi:arylsulfatase A-like enzyme